MRGSSAADLLASILLKDEPLVSDSASELLVTDFEIAHIGSRVQDIGQLLAELYIHYSFYGKLEVSTLIMKGFVAAYYNTYANRPLETMLDEALEVAMHFGIHYTVRPYKMRWPVDDKMLEQTKFGSDCVLQAWRKNSSFFEGGPLRDLFTGRLKT
jgi:hypothetical protein